MNNCDCCLVRYTDSNSYIKTNINSAWCCLIFLHLVFFFFCGNCEHRACVNWAYMCVCCVVCMCSLLWGKLWWMTVLLLSAFVIQWAHHHISIYNIICWRNCKCKAFCARCVSRLCKMVGRCDMVNGHLLLCAMCGWGFEEVRSPIAQWPRLITRKTRSEATAMCAIVCVYVCCVMCVMMKQPTC